MENKNKFKNIKFTMHKLTSISLIQQWHSTKHFKIFLCLSCPLLVELQYYLIRDLKKLHIKVVCVLKYQISISLTVSINSQINQSVELTQLNNDMDGQHLTCLSSQQVEHAILIKRLIHRIVWHIISVKTHHMLDIWSSGT